MSSRYDILKCVKKQIDFDEYCDQQKMSTVIGNMFTSCNFKFASPKIHRKKIIKHNETIDRTIFDKTQQSSITEITTINHLNIILNSNFIDTNCKIRLQLYNFLSKRNTYQNVLSFQFNRKIQVNSGYSFVFRPNKKIRKTNREIPEERKKGKANMIERALQHHSAATDA